MRMADGAEEMALRMSGYYCTRLGLHYRYIGVHNIRSRNDRKFFLFTYYATKMLVIISEVWLGNS